MLIGTLVLRYEQETVEVGVSGVGGQRRAGRVCGPSPAENRTAVCVRAFIGGEL